MHDIDEKLKTFVTTSMDYSLARNNGAQKYHSSSACARTLSCRNNRLTKRATERIGLTEYPSAHAEMR